MRFVLFVKKKATVVAYSGSDKIKCNSSQNLVVGSLCFLISSKKNAKILHSKIHKIKTER